jgi:hypothetical protein
MTGKTPGDGYSFAGVVGKEDLWNRILQWFVKRLEA